MQLTNKEREKVAKELNCKPSNIYVGEHNTIIRTSDDGYTIKYVEYPNDLIKHIANK